MIGSGVGGAPLCASGVLHETIASDKVMINNIVFRSLARLSRFDESGLISFSSDLCSMWKMYDLSSIV